jgi:hypothetical protein
VRVEFSETIAWCGIWCNFVIYYVFEPLQWKWSSYSLISYHSQFCCLCFYFSFDLWSRSVIIPCITIFFMTFSPLSILTVADDGSKQRYRKLIRPENRKNKNFQKRHNCEKLNTSSHAKCSAAILKNQYYTPCNTYQVITPPGDMTRHISNLLHMQN